jgi:hypothetical protein
MRNMKKILFCLIAMLVMFVLETPVHAELINRGTDTLGNRLIYDTDLNITWYDFTNANAHWQVQVDWADALSVDFGGNIFDDWRLPNKVDDIYVFGYDGTTTGGYNITNSEMGHLFYTELGNKGGLATDGSNVPSSERGLLNTGDFQNLAFNVYWTGTEYAAATDRAWIFAFDFGDQNRFVASGANCGGLAVRDGDVVEPSIIAFSVFTLTETNVKFKETPDNDELEVKGIFVLGEGNNGIYPVDEDVTVTVGTSSIVIPSPFSFEEETAGRFKFKGIVNDADVKMEIKETDFNTFEFKVRVKGVALTGTCNPVDIEIIVGDDEGQTNIRLNGLLKIDDGSSGHKKKK